MREHVRINPPSNVLQQIKLNRTSCAGVSDGTRVKCNDSQTSQGCRGIGGDGDRSCALRDHHYDSPSQTWVPVLALGLYRIK